MKRKLVVIAFALSYWGCTKEKIVEKPVQAPPAATITFASPLAGAEIRNGQNVHLSATISGVNTLHGYSIILVRNDEELVFYGHKHDHAKQITIDTTWVSNVPDTSDMEITVIAVTDHDGNTVGKTQGFTAIP